MSQNICINCKWAQWQMTKHLPPRVKPRKSGLCLYPLSRVAVPFIMERTVGFSETPYAAIWPDFTTPCRVWERKEQ